jgi:hypothetical protein
MKIPKPPKPSRLLKLKPLKPITLGGTASARRRTKPQLPPKNHPAGLAAVPKVPLPAGALPPAPSGLPQPNTTYDFYIDPNDAPAMPDKQGIQCHLEAEFEMATQHSQLDPTFRWTHRMYVQDSEDIRDNWPGTPANKVYIPDKTGTPFLVVFVEVLHRNTPQQYKRVFLKRQAPGWPTDNV